MNIISDLDTSGITISFNESTKDYSYGEVDVVDQHLSMFVNSKKPFRNDQSLEEIFVHEVVHIVVKSAFKLKNKHLINKLSEIYDIAKEQVKWEDFAPDHMTSREKKQAIAYRNYLFGKKNQDTMEEFLVYALTNPVMIQKVAKLKINNKKDRSNMSLADKIKDFIFSAVESINKLINSDKVDDVVEGIFRELAGNINSMHKAMTDISSYQQKGMEDINDKVSKMIKDAYESAKVGKSLFERKKITEEIRRVANDKNLSMEEKMSKVQELMNKDKKILNKETTRTILKEARLNDIITTIDDVPSKTREWLANSSFFGSTVLLNTTKQIMGIPEEYQEISIMLNKSKALIDSALASIFTETRESFNQNTNLSDDEKTIMNKHISDTDITSTDIDFEDFWEMVNDPVKLDQELQFLENKLSKTRNEIYYLDNAEQLADFMLTKKSTRMTFKNAYDIVNFAKYIDKHMPDMMTTKATIYQESIPSEKIEEDLDKYISLLSLSKSLKNNEIIKDEEAYKKAFNMMRASRQMYNKVHHAFEENAKKDSLAEKLGYDRRNVAKGFAPIKRNNNMDIKFDNKDNSEKLENEGWKRVDSYNKNIDIYVKPKYNVKTRVRGAFSHNGVNTGYMTLGSMYKNKEERDKKFKKLKEQLYSQYSENEISKDMENDEFERYIEENVEWIYEDLNSNYIQNMARTFIGNRKINVQYVMKDLLEKTDDEAKILRYVKAIQEVHEKYKDFAQGRRTKTSGEILPMPIFDRYGNIVDFIFTAPTEIQDKYLNTDTKIDTTIGMIRQEEIYKREAKGLNKELIYTLQDIADANFEDNKKMFKVINDASYGNDAKLWNSIPWEIRKELPDEGLAYPKLMEDDIFGYRTPDTLEQLKKIPIVKKFVEEINENDELGRGLKKAEKYYFDLVSLVKQNQVIKTPAVFVGNFVSNINYLYTNNYTTEEIVKGFSNSYKSIDDYYKTKREIKRLEDMPYNKSNIAKKQELEDKLDNNFITFMIKNGALQALVEDVFDSTALETNNLVEKKLKGIRNKYIGGTVTEKVVNELFLTDESFAYKYLIAAMQTGDFIAKSVVFDKQVDLGMSERNKLKILQSITNDFIDYAAPLDRNVEYLNKLGLFIYAKFYLGIGKTVYKNFKTNPTNMLFNIAMQDMITDIDSFDDTYFKGMDGRMLNPAEVIEELIVPSTLGFAMKIID